jgi:hypothetical protein
MAEDGVAAKASVRKSVEDAPAEQVSAMRAVRCWVCKPLPHTNVAMPVCSADMALSLPSLPYINIKKNAWSSYPGMHPKWRGSVGAALLVRIA